MERSLIRAKGGRGKKPCLSLLIIEMLFPPSTLLSPEWSERAKMYQIILVSVFFACSFPLSILLVVIVTVSSVLIFQGLTRIFLKPSLVTVLWNASLSSSLTVIAFLNLFVPAVSPFLVLCPGRLLRAG